MEQLPHRHHTTHNGQGQTLRFHPKVRPLCHCGSVAYWQCDAPLGEGTCGKWLCRIHRLVVTPSRVLCPWHKQLAEGG